MAIKTVACPQCGAKLNVPATMGSAKCSSCDHVFSTTGSQAEQATQPLASAVGSESNRDNTQWGAWIVAGGVFVLAVTGIIGLVFFGGDTSRKPGSLPASETAVASESPDDKSDSSEAISAGDYREIDLPESTRRKIFREHKAMIASSFGKAKKIPQGGAAGQALGNMLGATVDREITRMALIYGISEDDIDQVVLEGKAKDW